MASEVTTMTRKRRKFSKEFKLETVKLVKEGPRSIGEVARDLDLTESAVRNWVRQFDVDAGVREGVSTGKLEEPTARYEATTRARTLAPKLARMVETATEPVTVMVSGRERERIAWHGALQTAAHRGARVVHYLTPETSEEVARMAVELTDEFPQMRLRPLCQHD